MSALADEPNMDAATEHGPGPRPETPRAQDHGAQQNSLPKQTTLGSDTRLTCHPPVFFFAAVQFDDVLAGRTLRLAELLMARGRHVVFVEMPSVRVAVRRALGRTKPPAARPNLTIVRLPPLLGWTRLSESPVGRAWSAMARRVLKRRFPQMAEATAIVSTPWWMPILGSLPFGCLVYDFVDHVSVHAGQRYRERFERWERALLGRSDLVTTVSPLLKSFAEDVAGPGKAVHIPNGVASAWLEPPASPAEPLLARVPRGPRVGFVGALFEWIDFDLLAATARRLPDYHFVFVGPQRFGMPVQELLSLPNVHHFGSVPFEQVPRWLCGFDVCLIPFKQGIISEAADPLKLYEYLAAGRPVVSTIPFTVPGGPAPMAVATEAEGFARAIEEAVRQDSPQAQQQRRCFAAAHTWEKRVDDLLAAEDLARRAASVTPRYRGNSAILRVLMIVRPDLRSRPGGDSVQMLETAAALERLGVHVEISTDPYAEMGGFDVVHLCHLERVQDTLVPMRRARAAGKPIALSTIYWPRDGGDAVVGARRLSSLSAGRGARRGDHCLVEDAKNVYRWLRASSGEQRAAIAAAIRTGWSAARRAVLDAATVLLPNSQAEGEAVAREAGRAVRYVVVPNGVAKDLGAESAEGRRHGLLSVGHFDIRKNQLILIEAIRGLDVPLTLVGAARGMHRWYYQRCRWAAGPTVRFAGRLDRQQVRDHMRRARVHVCPSWFETPGLANLEAAVLGCVVVVPDCPPVREYFGDDAVYFRPGDVQDLRRAIERALTMEASEGLRERILERFTWDEAARKTLEGYRLALATAHAADQCQQAPKAGQ